MHFRSAHLTGVQQSALTLDAVRAIAPSAFATAKHESRSKSYSYIPTATVIEALVKEGFQPFKACQSVTRVEGKGEFTKHLLRFRHQDALPTTISGSFPEVVLINSHDGTSAYKLFAGVFRLVCCNGLIVADSTVGSLSVPHKGNIVDRVIEGSFQIIDQSKRALAVTEEWSQLQLSSGEQKLFARAAHELRFADEDGKVTTPVKPEQLLEARRSEDTGNDLWSTFNRIQEHVIRGGDVARTAYTPGRGSRRVRSRGITGIDQDVKLNRALWTLTEGMAELKGAALAA